MSDRSEIQTCNNWRGPGLAPGEIKGGTRHRWHCLECDEKGPPEVDGAVCRYQFEQHVLAAHGTTGGRLVKPVDTAWNGRWHR